jgi:5'-deoxynucleotidase YfbR-like HD superfamily hydrolase
MLTTSAFPSDRKKRGGFFIYNTCYDGPMYKDIDFTVFPPERKEKLEEIYRYHSFDTFLYRSNLWMHSYRVLWLLEALIPLAQKHFTFDIEKARILALVHDDAEMVTGDILAGAKARMTPEQLDALQIQEENAVKDLIKIYPKEVHGYTYGNLLLHAARKDCIEAKLVSYTDKLDAYCESMHEVLAGNLTLLTSAIFYVDTMALFPKKFPELAPLLSSKESPLTYLNDRISPLNIEAKRYKQLNRPYTKESISIETDFPFYNTWKKIVIEKGNTDWLINQKEYWPK